MPERGIDEDSETWGNEKIYADAFNSDLFLERESGLRENRSQGDFRLRASPPDETHPF
jgi:hypothetical protein